MHPYLIIGLLISLLGSATTGFFYGYHKATKACEAEIVQQQLNAVTTTLLTERENMKFNNKLATKTLATTEKIRTLTKVITKEVPVYVNQDANTKCVISNGFVLVHDAAAMSSTPTPPSESDATASGITLSQVAETVTDNYGSCNEIAEQLKGLQAWVNHNVNPKQ